MLIKSYFAVAGIVLAFVAIAHFLSRFRPPVTLPILFSWRWSTVEVLFFISAYLGINLLCYSFVMNPSVYPSILPPGIAADLATVPTQSDLSAGMGGAASVAIRSQNERARSIAGLWSSLFAAVILVAVFLWLSTIRESNRRISKRFPSWYTLQTAGLNWLAIAPPILAINIIVIFVSQFFNSTPEVHPLATIGSVPNITMIFLLSSCVAAPVMEELLVRGVLLPWACRSLKHSWFLFVPALLLVASGRMTSPLGPLAFFGLLVVGFWALLHFGPKREGTLRRSAAIYSTSVLFAMAHTSVWPTPIPLFVFSLCLSWLALRTGGVTASILVHGLLNLVSSIYVLSGGPL